MQDQASGGASRDVAEGPPRKRSMLRALLRPAAAAATTGSLMLGFLALPSAAGAAPVAHTASSSGLGYTPLSAPVRVCDTRSTSAAGGADVTSGVTGQCNNSGTALTSGGVLAVNIPTSVVPSGAGAVALTVTAIGSSAPGYLTVYPATGSAPSTLVSNLNFTSGQNVANMVTVGTSSTGAVDIYNGAHSGSLDVAVDVAGYYAAPTSTTGDPYTAITPTRVADTRCATSTASGDCSALPASNATLPTVGSGQSINVQVAGVNGIPSSATAVSLDVAETNATAASFLTAYPTGATQPTASNLNWAPGNTLASQVVASVGTGGDATLFNHAGNVDFVVDVTGYYTAAGTSGSVFTPLASPKRLADTRCAASPTPSYCAGESLPSANASLAAISGGQSINVATGAPSGATGIAANVTDVMPATGNFLTVWPTGATMPTTSTVNWVPANAYNVAPNAAYAAVSSAGSLSVYNGPASAGATNVVVDMFGYFAPPVTNQTYTVSPTTAQTSTVGTGYTDSSSAISYSASNLGTTSVCLALFPASGTNAPTTTNGTTTFTPNSSGDAAGLGTTDTNTSGTTDGTGAQIVSVNGVPTGATTTTSDTTSGPVTPTSGTVSFVLNTNMADSTIPVAYAATNGSCANLPVNSKGVPSVAYGVGGSATWSAAAATAGTYTGYEVISVNPSNNTFQASPTGSAAGALTFTYGQTGSGYNYDETPGTGGSATPLPIAESTFATDLSGIVPATPATSTAPATLGAAGDSLNIAYGGATNPSTFTFSGHSTNTTPTNTVNGDVPAAPTALTATYQPAVTNLTATTGNHAAGVYVSWTAPPNADVFGYQVQYATVNSSGVTGAFADAGNGTSVVSGNYAGQTDTGGFVAGTQSSVGVVETAPLTNFFDPNQTPGSKVVYRVVAYADGNNGNNACAAGAGSCGNTVASVGSSSPSTPNTASVTIVQGAVATVTGPLSTSTSYTPFASTDTTLAKGDTIDVFYNTPVSVASTWSLELADMAGNEALLDSTDATASVANGGLTVVISVTGTPTVLTGAEPTFTDAPFEMLQAGGITGTGTGTPAWNVEASGAGTNAVIEGGTSVAVTREIAGVAAGGTETTNDGIEAAHAAPTVTVYGSSASTTPNTIDSTCNTVGDFLNIYNADGSYVTSVACTAVAATSYQMPSGTTLTSGSTYIVGESPLAAPLYESAAHMGPESATTVALAE